MTYNVFSGTLNPTHSLTLPIATHGVVWSFGLFLTTVIPAKTAELIEMPFGCGLR